MSGCTEDRFLSDVKGHVMTVVRDDATGRHLRFAEPGNSCYWFDILTWSGRLYIGGDCGTYVFDRTQDMFKFFRADNGRINPQYWAEKVEASDRDGVSRFEWATFERDVKQYFDGRWDVSDLSADADEDDRKVYDEQCAKRDACWTEVQGELSQAEQDEYGACGFIRDFNHEGWHFEDWEGESKEFTHRFIWNCRAIVWAISQYDASKVAAQVAEVTA